MENWLEWIAVAFNLGFLYFMIREKVMAWPLGIVGSLILIYLFYHAQIYLEALVYVFYVGMGFFGWYRWLKGPEKVDDDPESNKKTGIIAWKLEHHAMCLAIGAAGTVIFGYLFDRFTDARFSYLDAFSTTFQLIATYLEARKVLSAWLYWIALNAFAIWFYSRAGLDVVATLQMGIFTVFSVVGYFVWRKRYRTQAVYG